MTPLLEPHRGDIEALCRRYHVRRLEVFGSAVRDDFDPARSDVDFLVEFEERHDVNFFNAYFDLREDLITLLGRPVDLVMPSAIRNPVVKADIDAHRELFYAA
jgi:hypothetical protein